MECYFEKFDLFEVEELLVEEIDLEFVVLEFEGIYLGKAFAVGEFGSFNKNNY
jgi:hypothetical protein